jgi:hypothetical protein
MEVEWAASRPGRFISGERIPGTHFIRGCVGPRAGLDVLEENILSMLEIEPLTVEQNRLAGTSSC